MACSIAMENVFGPSVVNNNCHRAFDFTLLFEETILGIAPLAITLLILPFQVHQRFVSTRKIRTGWLQIVKLVSTKKNSSNKRMAIC